MQMRRLSVRSATLRYAVPMILLSRGTAWMRVVYFVLFTTFVAFSGNSANAELLISQPTNSDLIPLDLLLCGGSYPCSNQYTAISSGTLQSVQFYGDAASGNYFNVGITDLTSCGGSPCHAYYWQFAPNNYQAGVTDGVNAMRLYSADASHLHNFYGYSDTINITTGDAIDVSIFPYSIGNNGNCNFSCFQSGTTLGAGTSWYLQAQAAASPTFHDVVDGRVHWSPGTIDMFASFSPKGKTLTEAAQLGNYDHFNWFQIATQYPGHSTPFVDPPPGGLLLQHADNLPFYWDETHCPQCLAEYYLHDPSNISADDRTLTFFDEPGNNLIPLLGDKMSFITQLAAVRLDGTWDALSTYMWSSDYNPACAFVSDLFGSGGDCGGINLARNVEPFPPGGTGGVFDGHEVTDLGALPLEVRELMVSNGATNIPLASVPVPSTISLLIAGICIMTFILLWRRKRSMSSRPTPR